MFDCNPAIHVFSTLVVRFGKYWALELSTSLSDYDFATNGFNERQTSFMEVNEFLTVLSTFLSDIHRQYIFQRLQAPWKSVHGRPYFCYGHKWNYICTYSMWEVTDALVKSITISRIMPFTAYSVFLKHCTMATVLKWGSLHVIHLQGPIIV